MSPVAKPRLLVKARVIGKVKAAHVIISTDVQGPVRCDEPLELQPRVQVQGKVIRGLLERYPGALAEGALQSEIPPANPEVKLTASSDT
jgi:cytoskeletal protein CcmA (bactofilin family)